MFKEWMQAHQIGDFLLPQHQFSPYPTCNDRTAWESISEERRLMAIREAEAYLGYQWPVLLATQFMAYAEIGDRDVYQIPYFARRRGFQALVLGECLEAKGRFLSDIINGIWAICEESFWGVSAHNGARNNGEPLPDVENIYIDLFAAETGGMLAWTLYLLGDKLDAIAPQVSRRVEIELERRIKLPFLNRYDFFWMGYMDPNVNNWNPWILCNTLSVFLLSETNENRRATAIVKMLECCEKFIDCYHTDGGCDEGTSYWSVAGGALFDFLEQLYLGTDGKVSFYEHPLVQEIGRFLYRSHIGGGYFINFSDGAALPIVANEMVYRYGKRIGDEKMMDLAVAHLFGEMSAAERDAFDQKREPVSTHLRRGIPGIFIYDEMKERNATFPYLRDIWLDGIQVMAAREAEGSHMGLYLAAKGGNNAESHNHNDVGSFLLFLNGQPALVDVGVENYTKKTFSPERYSIWTMRSDHHNLPDVDGYTQFPGKEAAATAVSYSQNDSVAEFGVNLENTYPKEACLAAYRRQLTLHREGTGSVTLTEQFTFTDDKTHTITAHFMSCVKPEVLGADQLRIPVEGGALLLKIPSTEGHEIGFAHHTTNDEKLHAVWGDGGIWQTSLTYALKTGEELFFTFMAE